MLPKEYRLPANTKLAHPSFLKTSLFTLRFAENNLTKSRFGFIIAKKKEKRAVYRNRIRRVFRSCIEDLRLQITGGYDMLFFLERGIMDKQKEELCKELEDFLLEKQLIKRRESS